MDVVTGHGALFLEKVNYKSSAPVFDVKVTYLLSHTTLTQVWTREGFALEEALIAKEAKYGGTCRTTYKPLPLAFSTCGDQSATVQDLLEELVKPKAEMS